MGWNARARAIIDFVWNNVARSHLVGNTQRITHAEQQLKRAERAIQAIRDQAALPPGAADALQELVDIVRTIEDRVSTLEKAKVVLT
jgi:uncharacterized membrane protein YccC